LEDEMRQIVFIVGVAGLLAACGAQPPVHPPGTEVAYYNGCQAGMLEGGRGNTYLTYRDEQAYAADEAYRAGWVSGYRECFDRAISEPRKR
jgi:hypothetical protein